MGKYKPPVGGGHLVAGAYNTEYKLNETGGYKLPTSPIPLKAGQTFSYTPIPKVKAKNLRKHTVSGIRAKVKRLKNTSPRSTLMRLDMPPQLLANNPERV